MSNDKPSILVVDNTPNDLYAMRQILEPLNLEIVEACSGEEALKQIIHKEFFLILMDVHMPGMDGCETATLILENQRTSHLPIIFVSAASKDDDIVFRGYSKGAVDYLFKPINEKILISKVGVFLALYNQKQEISKINEKLNSFASTASHDLKAPLRQISNYLNFLLEDYKDSIDEKGIGYIDGAIKASQSMSTLISDLLEYAKNRAVETKFEKVDLNVIVQDVVVDLETLIEEAKTEMILDKFPTIEANPVHMWQVFQNVLSNAIKYRREGVIPKISVSCKNYGDEKFRRDADKNKCQIFIQDNGIGFNEKHLDKVFAPFKRLVGKTKFEGSGLGMATVNEIIELHNGSITAKSTVGEGSTFIITLPVKQQ